jgi:hypothetical protein
LTPKRIIRFYPILIPFLFVVLYFYWPFVVLMFIVSLLLTMIIIKENIQIRVLSWFIFNVMNFAYCAGFISSVFTKE